MSLDHPALEFKRAPNPTAAQLHLASRLAAIRAEISFLHTLPYGYGRLNGPHRRQRDELILQGFAADLSARMIDAAS
jgi:hypothetical protein